MAALFLISGLAASGCAYLEDRGRDFFDIVPLEIGPGLGLGLDFQVTDAFHSGLGGGISIKFRLPRHALGNLRPFYRNYESSLAFILYRTAGPIEAPQRQGFLWNFAYWPDYFAERPFTYDWAGEATGLPLSLDPDAPWLNLLDFDLGCILPPLAARVVLSPGEILDFVIGWFGVDLAGDDGPGEMRAQTNDSMIAKPGAPEAAGIEGPVPGAGRAINPSFSLSEGEALAALEAMRKSPRALERPVVVLGGFMDPGLAFLWARDVQELTGDRRVLPVSFVLDLTMDSCRAHVIEELDREFPSDDPAWTTEVDVVGISLGGLVASYAALPPVDGPPTARRLRIARLFTISSPLRGAPLATIPALHPVQRAMRPESPVVRHVSRGRAEAAYQLYPYVRLCDVWVIPENAAPPGETPWWVANPGFQSPHFGAVMDPRIQADILRVLRRDTPYAKTPRVSPPAGS